MVSWKPTTEQEILEGISSGDLREHRGLDVKREIGDTNSPRRETARDLASFAIDGGAILIGVEEDKQAGIFTPRPIPLAGQAERIEQIAVTRVDPPLFVQVRDIPSSDGENLGYLFVEIPPSAQAPHMVDGEYWGRIDRTKGRLTDAQVVRLHSHRESVSDRIAAMLDEEIARDPVPVASAKEGHLYLVAWPISAHASAALPVLRDRDIQVLFTLINSAEPELSGNAREFAPGPGYASTFRVRAEGLAMTSLMDDASARALGETSDEGSMIDVEFREDGGIRVLMGRMTDTWSTQVICDGLAVAYSRRMVRWADRFGALFGYSGQWGFGIEATGLRDLSSSVFQNQGIMRRASVYDAERYRSITTASAQELVAQPWAVVERLIGKLLRALTTEYYYRAEVQAPEQ